MDIAMNFTLGLSQGIAWPWPIAVYLFLAGISGGAVAVALMLNRYRNQVAENTPVLKAATLVGFVSFVLGLICLVADLTIPLVFWSILIYYNLMSAFGCCDRSEHSCRSSSNDNYFTHLPLSFSGFPFSFPESSTRSPTIFSSSLLYT